MRAQLRISKTSWIALGTGIFIIALLSLGMGYKGQLDEQRILNEQLVAASQKLAAIPLQQLTVQQNDLKTKLFKVEGQIEAAGSEINLDIKPIDNTDELFQIAEEAGVVLEQVKSSWTGSETISEVMLLKLPFTLTVSGDVDKINNFVRIITKKFSTSVALSVEVTVPPPPDPDKPVTSPSATLDVNIYSYEGK